MVGKIKFVSKIVQLVGIAKSPGRTPAPQRRFGDPNIRKCAASATRTTAKAPYLPRSEALCAFFEFFFRYVSRNFYLCPAIATRIR